MKNLFGLLFCLLTIGFVSCGDDDDGDSTCTTCEVSLLGVGTTEVICDLGDGTISREITVTGGVAVNDTITAVYDTYVSDLDSSGYDCD